MERIDLKADDAIERAAEILRKGGVILFPTDTLYGLGADAFSDAAVDKIYAIKGRDERKPIHCIVTDIAMAGEYAEVTADAKLLFERLMPGGLTIILKKSAQGRSASGGKAITDHGIGRGIDTIGIRIPQNDFCTQLARTYGKPLTATSANLAGMQHLTSVDAIMEQLGNNASDIDLVIDAGKLAPSLPSTVVDMSDEEPVILREGVIPAADVWNAIRAEIDN